MGQIHVRNLGGDPERARDRGRRPDRGGRRARPRPRAAPGAPPSTRSRRSTTRTSRPSSSSPRRRPTPRSSRPRCGPARPSGARSRSPRSSRRPQKIVDLWQQTGMPVQVGFMRRFDPGYVRAKELIDSGRARPDRAVPRPVAGHQPAAARVPADLRRLVPRHVRPRPRPGPLPRRRGGGGPRLGARSCSTTASRRRTTATPSVIMLRSATAPWASSRRPATPSGATTSGPRSRARWARSSWTAAQKTPATHSRDVRLPRATSTSDFLDRFEVAYRRELEVFFENLGAGKPVAPGPDDALETLRLAVACTRSWRESRPVRLDEVTA